MTGEQTAAVLPPLLTAMVALSVALIAWWRRSAPGALPLVVIMLGLGGWAMGYVLELIAPDLAGKSFWYAARFPAVATLPGATLALVLEYTGYRARLTRRTLALLATPAILLTLLMWTNPGHGLIWTHPRLLTNGSVSVLDFDAGIGWWMQLIYAYTVLAGAGALLLYSALRAPALYRRQAWLILSSLIIVWLGSVFYASSNGAATLQVYIGYLAAWVGMIVLAGALLRWHLFDLVPVARETLIESMSDAVIVLDAHDRIVDLNPAARRILDPAVDLGQPLAQALAAWPDLLAHVGGTQPTQTEITLGRSPAARDYDLRISPVTNDRGRLTGRLIVLRDITARTHAEHALYQAREAVLSAMSRLEQEQETAERLLLNVLPAPIAGRLKAGQHVIADHFSEVTVLFADIVDFTVWAAGQTPAEVVAMLNTIFSAFDYLAERHGLEKIKTMGDTYIVVGGLPTPRPDHAEAVAAMALDMQQALAELARDGGAPLRMRIGIHSGPVVAGVIGTTKFSYDLWGDTVNIASRMESQGVADCIQVSAATYARLASQFGFATRGVVTLKGRGDMQTYFLVERRGPAGSRLQQA